MRIVSLLASRTELVCALGAGDELVGRSHECDHPAWVTRLPALRQPTCDVGGSSAEIDRLTRQKLRAGEPLYALAWIEPRLALGNWGLRRRGFAIQVLPCRGPATGSRKRGLHRPRSVPGTT
jgi:hypothetical protein